MDDYLTKYGPWALIAGASVGIGAAMAEQLAKKGFNLILIARTKSKLDTTCEAIHKQYGVEAKSLPLDLTREDAANEIMKATANIDVGLLIYNAALGYDGAFWAGDLDYYHKLLQCNMRTPFDLVYKFAPRLMEKRRGGIIMVSSAGGLTGQPYLAAYAGTKAWNTNFSMCLWGELKRFNVDILNSIVGATDTPGLESVMTKSHYEKLVNMGLATAEEVAIETLKNLGKQPVHITGRNNRLVMGAVRLMGLNRGLRFMTNMVINTMFDGSPPKQPVETS